MAHEITTRADGFNEIAFVGATPWHGLGQELQRDASLETWRKAAGLDWRIQRAPVMYGTSNDPTRIYTGQDVLYRSDNDESLSIVSSRYKEVQPEDVLGFFKTLTEVSGYRLHTAGSLNGGRRIWALAETGKVGEVGAGDAVASYVLLATSCDKGMATSARFTSVRVVCANTLRAAQTHCQTVVSVPHSTVFNPEAVQRQMGIAVNAFDIFMHDARQLAAKTVTKAKVDDFMAKLMAPHLPSGTDITKNRAVKRITELFDGRAIGSDLPGVNGTAWGLVNAVTEFVDHHNPSRTSDSRMNNAWFGAGDRFKNEALELAISLW